MEPAIPSIEIVCVGQSRPLDCSAYPFAVEASAELVSHRTPAPRFQSDFDALSGVLYHLGNPGLGHGGSGPFFAYELLSPASRGAEPPSFLEFAPAFAPGIFALLERLLEASPRAELLFTSDWQFGPDHTLRMGGVSLSGLRELHDAQALLLNAAYRVHEG